MLSKIPEIFSFILFFFFFCFFPICSPLRRYPLSRHERSPEKIQNSNSSENLCFSDTLAEICFLKNLQYNINSSLKTSYQRTIPLNLTIDLTSNVSWVKDSKIYSKNETTKLINSSKLQKYMSSFGNFSGETIKVLLRLIENKGNTSMFDKFDIIVANFNKTMKYFKSDGILSLSTQSKILEKRAFSIKLQATEDFYSQSEVEYSELYIGNLTDLLEMHKHSKINWVQLKEYQHYWALKINSLAIAFTNHSKHLSKIINFNESNAILTLSSSMVGFPEETMNEFLQFMNSNGSNASCFVNKSSFNSLECKNMKFPLHFEHLKFIMDFQGSDNIFHLDWQLLIRKCEKKEKQKYHCKLNIYQTVNRTLILGEPCFRGHVSIFDSGHKKVGFFKIKNENIQQDQNKTIISPESEESSPNLKLIVILLVIFICVLIGLILMVLFRRNLFRMKKMKRKKKNLDETARGIKDDSDVKAAVKEFEYESNNGKNGNL